MNDDGPSPPAESSADSTRDPKLPRKLGPYRLESLLGRGGMGEAFRAWDARLERHVAIKHVRDLGGERDRARFRREARIAARLSHPSVVEIHDVLERDDGDWIVMEWVDGRTLAQLPAPLAVIDVLVFGRQVAEGLSAAHRAGIIHRDLKTENVMVYDEEPPRIKILDFGLAKTLTAEESEASISVQGQVMGTARAMSPEQAQGLPVDPRSDLFSLGTLLYEIATGVSPFRGDTFFDTMTRVVSHTQRPAVDLAPNLPPELSRLIDRLLQKAPELRPASAAEVAQELARLAGSESQSAIAPAAPFDDSETLGSETLGSETLDGPPVPAAPPSRAPTARLEPARRRPAAVLAGLLGVALVVGILWYPMRPRSEPATGDPLPTAENRPSEPAREEVEDPAALFRRGLDSLRNYHRPGEVDRAIELFQRLLERFPDSAPAHAGLARAYWQKFDDTASKDPMFLSQASAAAEEAVALDEYLAEARISRALVYVHQGKLDEAEADLELARRLDPPNAEIPYAFGRLEEVRGRPEAATEAYRRAVELAPDDRRFYDVLGRVYFQLGRYDEAEEAFLQGAEKAPDSIHGLRNLAAIYHVRGRYDKAASMIQEALKIRPDGSLYSNLGYIFYVQGLYARAADAYEKALDMAAGSNNYLYWANLADAYRRLPARAEEADEHYRQALRLVDAELERRPESVELHSRRALYLAKRSDFARALEELDALLDAGGNEDRSFTASTLYRAAVTYEIAGKRARALEVLGRALEAGFSTTEAQNDPELRDLRADPTYQKLMLRIEEPRP